MQEQKLLLIESRGIWFAFWGLFGIIIIQFSIGTTIRELAGELIVFIPLALYITIACIRNGIWTRNSRPTTRLNAYISFVPMMAIGIAMLMSSHINAILITKDSILTTVLFMLAIYIGCFLSLQIAAKTYTNKRNKLDNLNEK